MAQILISKNDRDEEAYTLKGLAHLDTGAYKEALESFKKATELNGIYRPAYEGLVRLYEKKNNLYELRILYQDMIDKLGEKPEFLSKLCDINTQDSLNDHALDYCRRAIQKSDLVPENHINLGLIYRNMNENQKAQEKLRSTADRFRQSASAQLVYAQFVEEKKDSVSAYKYFSKCTKLDGQNEVCLLGHANAAAGIFKMDEAYEILKKLCLKDRKYAVAVRKVVQHLKVSKKTEWVEKFETLGEKCMLN